MNCTPHDPTPEIGSATDVSPLGTGLSKPPHERTCDEDLDVADWDRIVDMPEFRDLLRQKIRWIASATVLFIVYYFALPILVGYAPKLMNRKILGEVNLAYIFALSQFFMAWGIAYFYVRAASRFDLRVKDIIRKVVGDAK